MPCGQTGFYSLTPLVTIVCTVPIIFLKIVNLFDREAIDSFCSAKVGRTNVSVSLCGACRGEALGEDESVAN